MKTISLLVLSLLSLNAHAARESHGIQAPAELKCESARHSVIFHIAPGAEFFVTVNGERIGCTRVPTDDVPDRLRLTAMCTQPSGYSVELHEYGGKAIAALLQVALDGSLLSVADIPCEYR